MNDVFVRAKTSDECWASVNVVDLDERSWRRFIANHLCNAGILCGTIDGDDSPLTTSLTRDEAESE